MHSASIQDRDGIKLLLENPQEPVSLASPTCGWMPDTPAKTRGRRLGAKRTGMDGRDRAPPAQAGPGGGDDEVGQGVGERGRVDGPQEAAASGGPQGILAAEVGGREDLFLVGAEPKDEQRLRARLPESAEAFVYVAMSRLMVRRLARV